MADQEKKNILKDASNDLQTFRVKDRTIVSSSGISKGGILRDDDSKLIANIENLNGFDLLKLQIQPGGEVITNQETMSYMDGGLITTGTLRGGGFFDAVLRGISGASAVQNRVQNTSNRTLQMVLSPLLQGSIVQVKLQPGETWRFADRSFLACTTNLRVSGNINIFANFRMLFVSENLTYVTVSAGNTGGTVWVSSHGACETHVKEMGANSSPFFINNGCFLGMLDSSNGINYYNDYVRVGLPSSFFQSVFTQLGFVMKIQDTIPPKRAEPVQCVVLTQSLNPHNLEKFIAKIVEHKVDSAVRRNQGVKIVSNLIGGKERETRETRKTRKIRILQ